jgi:hypothetical protein
VVVYKNAEIKSWLLPGTGSKGLRIFQVWFNWFKIIAITFSLKGEK